MSRTHVTNALSSGLWLEVHINFVGLDQTL